MIGGILFFMKPDLSPFGKFSGWSLWEWNIWSLESSFSVCLLESSYSADRLADSLRPPSEKLFSISL
jgi:hypothetical protein